jgi:pimeloyl-ACP methyl ester carboxylesterase
MKARDFRLLKSNGITLRAVVEGEGPLCILVHGWPESWYSWRHQIDPLVSQGYRVCVPDVRGYGGSDKPQAIEAYDMQSMAGDVVGLIDALGAEQAILIGHDWGAPIVWQTSILHRARVRAVIGLSVPHLGRGPEPAINLYRKLYKDRFFYQLYFQEPGIAEQELEADVRTSLRKIYASAAGATPAANMTAASHKPASARKLDGMSAPAQQPAWFTEQDLEYYTKEFERSGLRGPLNRYRNQERDWEALPQLATEHITQPALFIAGSRDPVLRFVAGLDLLQIMSRWYDDLRGKVVLDGIGHWTQQEDPEGVNRAISDFLKSI